MTLERIERAIYKQLETGNNVEKGYIKVRWKGYNEV